MSTPVAFASLPTVGTGVHADQSVANVQEFWFNLLFCELLQRSEHPHVNSLVGATAAGSQELFQRAEPIP